MPLLFAAGALVLLLLARREAPRAAALVTEALRRYAPGSPEAVGLFTAAAQLVNLPLAWAGEDALQQLLRHESDGRVGIPNYTYGAEVTRDPSTWPAIWAELRAGRRRTQSSATGLGQLLLANVDKYYPAGRAGIGVPLEEAAGMLRYLDATYGKYGRAHGMSPAAVAWQFYGKPKPAGWGMPPTAEGY